MKRRQVCCKSFFGNLAAGREVVQLVQRLKVSTATAEDVAIDPPWEHLEQLIAHVHGCGHSEDVVKLFESPLLGLGNPEEDHNKRSDIEGSEM